MWTKSRFSRTIAVWMLLSTAIFAQTKVWVPDANFRIALITNTPNYNITSGVGDTIIVPNIAAVDTLNIDGSFTYNLRGIEKFINLLYLQCSSNGIDTLDLSNNINLQYLNCSNNGLKYLNISNNINLQYLDCHFNRLKSLLDVSQNVNLQYLDCSDNQLTVLDVSKNINLQTLDCSYNNLTILNVNQNINLVGLWCHSNQLSNLDISQNVNLQKLNCGANPLIILDVSNNVNLQELYCYSNQLSALDVSKNVNLQNLWCEGNNFSLLLNLAKNTKLTEIKVDINPNLQTLFVWQNPLPQGVTLTKDAATTLVVPKSTSTNPLLTTFSSGYYIFDTTGAIMNVTQSPSNNGTLTVTANSNPTIVGTLPNGITTLAKERYWSFSGGGLTGLKYDLIIDLTLLKGITDFNKLKVLWRSDNTKSWSLVNSNYIEYHTPYIRVNNFPFFGEFAIGGDASNPSLPVVEETRKEVLPTTYSVSQNYPNPFNPTTTINYQIPTNTFVTLKVYDVLGKEITTLVNKEMKVGTYTINFDASSLSGGMYFYKLTAGNFSEVKKMVLVK